MTNPSLPIGEAARLSGVKVPTIRYYEQIGLLPEPARSGGNRRSFGSDEVRRLIFIRHARDLGFDLAAIRELLDLQDDPTRSCAAADAIARARLQDVEWRLGSLRALKRELLRMLAGCASGHVADCRVIETLADHSKCVSDRH
jgi:DNA-binding transcriptional MerR regulator